MSLRLSSYLVAALVFFGVSGLAHAEKKTVRVGTLTVYATKASGAAWDIGDGAPDLRVVIREKRFASAPKSTSKKSNTYSATFNEDTISIGPGSSIEITVLDKDVLSDDTIGYANIVIDADDFRRGGVAVRFGRVRSLTLFFR